MASLRNLSLRQLRALSATARSGSVTAAAKALNLTPPAISTQLKLLENMTGAALLIRTSSGFEPTDLGREMLSMADEMEGLIARAEDRIGALRSGAEGSINLGVVSTGKYYAPRLVAAFQQAHPRIRVKLLIGNRDDIIRGLQRRDYDLSIMGRPPPHVDATCEVLGDHPYVLVAPPGHRLVAERQIRLEHLLRETFLTREEGSGTRLLMSQFLERIGKGRIFDIVEMGTNETIKQAVMAGLGIAVISAHTCHTELEENKLVTLNASGMPLIRQWFLIHRNDRPLTRAAEVFRSFVIENKSSIFPHML